MADSILNLYIVLLQKLLCHLYELINMAMGVMTQDGKWRVQRESWSPEALV